METTKNNLPDKVKNFFNRLSDYLNTKLLYYGSVQRRDYFPGKSDIDVDIFTDNVNSTIIKMQHYLHVERKKFKKFVWIVNHNHHFTTGYKIFYKDPNGNFSAEFSIYDEKYKEDILKEHLSKTVLPLHATCLLIILKFLYYKFGLMNHDYFKYLKRKILTIFIGKPDDMFIVLDQK
jgi:hypothetical protein